MMDKIREKLDKLPKTPGIYLFKDKNEEILYIGKANNIKKRITDHIRNKNFPDNIIIPKTDDIDFIETENEKQALLLELDFIKKYKPRYNTQWQDDKNYSFVAVTNEKIPQIFTTHQPKIMQNAKCKIGNKNKEQKQFIGPFISAKELKRFMASIRKILPFRTCKVLPKKTCLYFDMGLCLGYCVNPKLKKKYSKILQLLEAMLKTYQGNALRIEAYDISNLSGSLATGSMIVFNNNKPDKSQYKKFKIKTIKGQNDVASLHEILRRRLKHFEWPLPDLIILDGGKGQLKTAKNINIPVLAMSKVKRDQGKSKIFSLFSKQSIILDKQPDEIKKLFYAMRNEAHRFAISYNIKRREMKLIK